MKLVCVTLISLISLLGNCGYDYSPTSDKISDAPIPEDMHGVLQKPQDSLISKLAAMDSKTLDCSAEAYWKIIQRGESSIVPLIESLTDTRLTNIYNECKKQKLNVGEVSYFALQEIAEFPAFLVTNLQFDLYENDCWNFYNYFFDNKNKADYQKMVRSFYTLHKTTGYAYVKYKNSEIRSCHKHYKIEGKLRWIK